MGSSESKNLVAGKFEPSVRLKTASYALTGVGLIVFLVGVLKNPKDLWPAYLTAFFFVSCLGLGGLFWAAINHISKAGWSVSIRRIAESMTSFVPVMIVGSLVLLGGLKYLYSWMDPEVLASNYLVAAKTAYLNQPFLIVRLLVFGFGVLIFRNIIVGNSIKQDANGDVQYTHKNVGWSIGYILFFAIAFSMFSVDLLMSLLPTWYSTIFGIYAFSGMFQSTLALFILMLIYIKRKGYVRGYYGVEHIHDVAKFMKGFTVFWAYIAFSQFMLIWYANIPEETEFYLLRFQGGWTAVSIALLVFKFIVPFLALLPRAAKRNEAHLILVSILILVMQYLDVFWLVGPNFHDGHLQFGIYHLGALALFLGLFISVVISFLQKNGLVAVKDPRMHEALNHHVTY